MLRKRPSNLIRSIRWCAAAALLITPCGLAGDAVAATLAADGSRTDLAVIVNPKVPGDNFSMAELRRIMTGDKQYWGGDQRVTVLVPGTGMRERATVLKVVYQMTETQYRQFWLTKRFRQETLSEPKAVDSDKALCELIASIPGTIGIVDSAKVPSSVKVIRIDKLLPGSGDYPIH